MSEYGYFRGDIYLVYLVDFEPARTNEASKIRPSILVSNEQANAYGTSVIVVPLTSNTEVVYPFQVFLSEDDTQLNRDSKAQIELMRSVSKARLGKRVGKVSEGMMFEIDNRLKLQLGLV